MTFGNKYREKFVDLRKMVTKLHNEDRHIFHS